MKNKLLLSFCASAFLIANAANAAVYFEDFEGFAGGDLVGQNGWTSNSSTPEVGFVIDSGLDATVWGTNAASIGYVAPVDTANVFVSTAIPSTSLANAGFSTLFQIVDSFSDTAVPGSETRDTFGFRLENSSGDNLFSLFMSPFAQSATPESDTAFHTFSWSTGMGAPTNVLDSPLLAAQEEFAYMFAVNFFDAGAGNVGFNANVNGEGFSGLLPGLSSEDIATIGAFWDMTSPVTDVGGFSGGSNYMLFDNMTVIPEPTSALATGLLLASGIMLRSRRKRA